jgi:hypothetical protein
MSYPGLEVKESFIRDQVRLVDVFPTIAEISGLDAPEQCEGSSLLRLIREGKREKRDDSFFPDDFALTECTTKRQPATRSLRTNDWKVIVESLTSSIELYNVKDDPGETYDLWGKGLAYGDALISMIQRIPAVSLRGWRLSFTGVKTGVKLQADLNLPQGGRFTRVETLTRRSGILMEFGPDSTQCRLVTDGAGAHTVFVNTKPSSVPVAVEISKVEGEVTSPVFYGESGEAGTDEALLLDTETGLGTPTVFKRYMRAGRPGVHIWWMPGEDVSGSGKTTDLTPEEIKRLKSLGYIQ